LPGEKFRVIGAITMRFGRTSRPMANGLNREPAFTALLSQQQRDQFLSVVVQAFRPAEKPAASLSHYDFLTHLVERSIVPQSS